MMRATASRGCLPVPKGRNERIENIGMAHSLRFVVMVTVGWGTATIGRIAVLAVPRQR